jgi:citrate synthase
VSDVLQPWETAIAAVEPQLLYRGYPAEELAGSRSYLECAYLLLTGELPTDEQHADWQALMFEGLTLSPAVRSWLRKVPASATTIDAIHTALVRGQLGDDRIVSLSGRDVLDSFPHWLGFIAALATQQPRVAAGQPLVEPRSDLGFAANLLWMLRGREPSPFHERSLETCLITAAEHGFTPTTIAVRLVAAGGGDFLAALLAGLSVAQGPTHAGVAAQALDVLSEVRTGDRADGWVRQRTLKGQSVPGFVHRRYRVGDPRAEWLSPLCRRMAELNDKLDREELAGAIEQAVWDQQHLLPAVAWPSARIMDYLDIDRQLFVPLYVLGRMAGWAAHFVEQRQTALPRVFRTHYTGPAQRHVRSQRDPT